MAYTYKKITTQDFTTTPFNAHKQYNFTSASSTTNQVKIFSTNYTSESVSIYSSASSNTEGIFDRINNIKYNQLDHLFYKDYLKQLNNKLDYIDSDKQRRDLYGKSNIISIPSGLYGSEIKKSSFYLSSSQYGVTDDSYGNLIISGTNVDNYPNDVQENVFRLDPIKGFRKYDLTIYDGYAVHNTFDVEGTTITKKQFWRQGLVNPLASTSYTSDNNQVGTLKDSNYFIDEDDSYFNTKLNYNKITFKTSSLGSSLHKFPSIFFNSYSSSFIKAPNNSRYNFNTNDNFAISFWITPQATGSQFDLSNSERRYIIAKSGTKTITDKNTLKLQDKKSEPQYPFEIFMQSSSLYFARSDGDNTIAVNGNITSSDSNGTLSSHRTSHILCQNSASVLELYIDGVKVSSQPYTLSSSTRNNANLYIGSKGPIETTIDSGSLDSGIGEAFIGGNFVVENFHTSQNEYNYSVKHFNGDLSNINIWNKPYTPTQITNISESINASPYIGNIFYQSGFATITHPKYASIAGGEGNYVGNMSVGEGFTIDGGFTNGINTLQFQGTHLIREHEYVCTIQEHEYNNTTNITTRKTTTNNPYEIADFTTSSFFQPHVTTIGLYNAANELLIVAKLGQPIRVPNNTDLTFVIRWDE